MRPNFGTANLVKNIEIASLSTKIFKHLRHKILMVIFLFINNLQYVFKNIFKQFGRTMKAIKERPDFCYICTL